MNYKIAVLPGDGIGPEVIEQAVRVLEATGLNINFQYAEIGYGAYQKTEQSLPEKTLETIMDSDSTLLGAVTTPTGIKDYRSPILQLRQKLDLYANIRPSKSIPHNSSRENVDLLIVRENTEGLYSGRERYEDDGNTAITERVITRGASERIIRKAFDIAESENRETVHAVHKANVLRKTCGLFLETFYNVAKEYPNINAKDLLVDSTAMKIVRSPQDFEVIVTTNLFGDILSDIASEVVGGLGLASSGNIGDYYSVFEPVHGSAPDIVGKGSANPYATILASAMMLEHLAEYNASSAIRNAVDETIKQRLYTPDLGGILTTREAANAVIERM